MADTNLINFFAVNSSRDDFLDDRPEIFESFDTAKESLVEYLSELEMKADDGDLYSHAGVDVDNWEGPNTTPALEGETYSISVSELTDDDDIEDHQRLALARHHGELDLSEITRASYGDNTFEYGGDDYLVVDDDEADEAAKAHILDSLWAFNVSFISAHTVDGLDEEQEAALTEMQGKLCEGANSIVKAMITDLDHFVQDAIGADGRGHFLSQYDGHEQEEGSFFIYRN